MKTGNDVRRKQQEVEHGRRIAAEAEHVWQRDTRAGRQRIQNRLHHFNHWIREAPQGELLELGCGTGVWTQEIAALPLPITAVDLSEDLIAIARQKPQNSRVHFAQADIEKLPFKDAQFQTVCGLSVLHHLDLDKALAELRRVLRPGGRIWFSEPNMMNPQIFLQKNIPWLKRWAGDTPSETAFFRWSLKKALARFGFIQIQVVPIDFLHPQIPESFVNAMNRLSRRLEQTPFIKEIAGSLIVTAQTG